MTKEDKTFAKHLKRIVFGTIPGWLCGACPIVTLSKYSHIPPDQPFLTAYPHGTLHSNAQVVDGLRCLFQLP